MRKCLYTLVLLLVSSVAALSAVTVTISAPVASSTVCSPLTVNASASTTTLGATITGWQINNGNTILWNATTNSPTLSQNLTLAVGTYNLIVKAFDSGGFSNSAAVNPVTVSASCSGGTGGGGTFSINPTTTLAAQQGNNSGASPFFTGFSNGDLAATNISHVDMHNLLYSGNTTKIFPTVILWWCQSGGIGKHVVSTSFNACRSHVENANNYDDVNDIKRVDDDAVGRHIDGMMLDWYGRGNTIANFANQDSHAANFVSDMNGRAGTPLKYTWMLDHSYSYTCGVNNSPGSTGTPGWTTMGYASMTACMTGEINADLDYLHTHYFSGAAQYVNPATGKIPIVPFITSTAPEFNAGCTTTSQTCWQTVWDAVITHTNTYATHIELIFENSPGFTKPDTAGAYQWAGNSHSMSASFSTDEGLAVIDAFVLASKNHSTLIPWGGSWKGFNDSIASWGSGRLIAQQCGKTWLDTFSEWGVSKYFSSSHQLPYLQPVTWSDYEEGTEIESGIDSCLTVSSSLASAVLSWSTSGAGSANNIDHFTVYISTDQNNLAVLQDNIAAGTTSLNLANYNLGSGTYYLYVQMVAKSSMKNSISTAQKYALISNPPTASLVLTPTSGTAPLTVSADASGSSSPNGTISSQQLTWGDGSAPVALSPPWTSSHIFGAAGQFTVSLAVSDTTGLQGMVAGLVTVTGGQTGYGTVGYGTDGYGGGDFFGGSVLSLFDGAYVYSPIRIQGTLVTGTTATFAHVRIYVDGAIVFDVPETVSTYTLDKYVPLSTKATHEIYIEGVDTNGNVSDSAHVKVYCVGLYSS